MLIQIYGAARTQGQRSITPPQSVFLAATVACNETEERMKGGVWSMLAGRPYPCGGSPIIIRSVR